MILIVGAGPVGCYAAAMLAKKHKVIVIEEHQKTGKPIQCTGIVTADIFNYLPKTHQSIINKVKSARIIAPNNKEIKITLTKPDILLNREMFDTYFYNRAKKAGAKFLFKHRLIEIKKKNAIVKDLNTKKEKIITFSKLIGADGPNSTVGIKIGMIKKRRFQVGMQAIVKKRNNGTIDFYPYKEGFGWSVPEDKNTLRVGVAATSNVANLFEKILRRYKGKIIEKQTGTIPLYNPMQKLRQKNIFLIGDAAGYAKATTGGGIISGLKSAELVTNHILKNKSLYNIRLKLNLWFHLKIRNIMDTYEPSDWNRLINEFNKPSLKKILANTNREQSLLLLIRLTFASPKLLLFGLKPKHIKGWF